MVARKLMTLSLVVLVAGCGVDGLLFGALTRGDQDRETPLQAAPNILQGKAPGYAGAALDVVTGAGDVLDDLTTSVADDNTFSITVAGNTSLTNLVLVVDGGASGVWGVVSEVPAQTSIKAPPQLIAIGELNARTTLATLLVLAKARATGQTLTALAPTAVDLAVGDVLGLLDAADDRITPLWDLVISLPPMRTHPGVGQSYLAAGDTTDFDAALATALGAFEFRACYPTDQIRLVLIADLRPGGVDRNCQEIDRFLWASDAPGKSRFVTGGIHIDTPRCGETTGPCLDEAAFDAASQKLGNWVPNQVQMYDDGTHGDAAAGDNLWTVSVDMPYWDPGGLDQAGVRVGYKYTYGFPGQGWTESEEWPGNKRLIELRDLNGDHVITRQDFFGDETTNKDKFNLLTAARGGCGKVVFPSQPAPPKCVNDSLEAMIDSDLDCELDAWPAPGLSGPITLDCPDS